jgi:DMSO/TMAO reductase YedYZ molybdopterin-dependent catalytic subunit
MDEPSEDKTQTPKEQSGVSEARAPHAEAVAPGREPAPVEARKEAEIDQRPAQAEHEQVLPPQPGAEAKMRLSRPAPEPGPTEPVEPVLNRREWGRLNRREVLKLTPIVLAGAFLLPGLRKPLLEGGLELSEWASSLLFSKSRLAPTFASSAVVPFEKFPYNGYDVLDPRVDLDNWTLTVEGRVQRSGKYRLPHIQGLPKITQNVRHVCVEGWDAIGSFGGTRIADFLQAIGADMNSRFLEVECADDYYEAIDMASALHPQSLLCYEMYGRPLNRGHGAPLRLNLPTKLGYKSAKYLVMLRVSNVLNQNKRGYWEDQGYGWFAGM